MRKVRLQKRWMWVGLLLVVALGLALTVPGVALGRAAGRAWLDGEVVYGDPLRADSSPDESTPTDPSPAGELPAGSPTPASGSASLPESFFDFGDIPATGQVQHDFLLRNQGSGPLVIKRAYTTCGCTTAEISASVIPPGRAARITVTFDAGYHPLSNVTVRRGLIIESSDPLHPQLELWVQASVK